MTPATRPLVAVVGGGIAGLAAAWELVGASGGAGEGAGDRLTPDVVVIEAEGRLGGKLQSMPFAGRTVDLGADAFLARRPEATRLVDELGASDDLVGVGTSGTSLLAGGALRPLPDGLVLGIPTRWWALARSGVLSRREWLRMGYDLVAPRAAGPRTTTDRAVGDLVAGRLGRGVVDRLVDPLVGGIHAGGVDTLSAAATFPALLEAWHQPGSLVRRLDPRRTAAVSPPSPPAGAGSDRPAPVFWSLAGGTASLVGRLEQGLRAAGATFRLGTRVRALSRTASGWTIELDPAEDDERYLPADGVVLATPARTTAALLGRHAPRSARILAAVEHASVAVVTVSLPSSAWLAPRTGTGFLVPRREAIRGRPYLVTGCTYLSDKWPLLARDGDVLVRLSVGRLGDRRHEELDDDELTTAVLAELGTIVPLSSGAIATSVTRWAGAFPQYAVGHLERMATIDGEIADLPGLALAGATYRGVGIPACIGTGREAAAAVRRDLARSHPGLPRSDRSRQSEVGRP
ncbi:MAG: protoporphyrinogen oxidase [Actinomycetota bacterium]|nr:protoporphyrinogen oxidase [Actinomycetota bacterium]